MVVRVGNGERMRMEWKKYVSKVKRILLKLKNSLDKPDLKERIEKMEKP